MDKSINKVPKIEIVEKTYGNEKAVILEGRMRDIMSGFLMPILRDYADGPGLGPGLAKGLHPVIGSLMSTKIYKYMRLRHHPVADLYSKDKHSHTVCYAVFDIDGGCGLSRDDGRAVKWFEEMINEQPWYIFPCIKKGCKGAILIKAEGIPPVILGEVDLHNGKEWNYCQDTIGCVII